MFAQEQGSVAHPTRACLRALTDRVNELANDGEDAGKKAIANKVWRILNKLFDAFDLSGKDSF
jgi:hypothetical protein